MTKEEFDNTEWYKGMKVKVNDFEYDVVTVDFSKRQVGSKYFMAPCELVTLIH